MSSRGAAVSPRRGGRVANRAGLVALCSGLILTLGCGSGIDLEDVSGNATFAGKPIVYGQIDFMPDTEKGHSGPAGSAEIVDGRYDTAEGGRGIIPGPHSVRITAYEERPPVTTGDNELQPSLAKPPIFSGYSIAADLTEETMDFDVPESARGFDIFSNKPARRRSDAP